MKKENIRNFFLCLSFFILMTSSCFDKGKPLRPEKQKLENLFLFNGKTPNSSKLVEYYAETKKSIDPTYTGKVEVSKIDFETIKKDAELALECKRASPQKPPFVWWNPKSIIFEKEFFGNGGNYYLIFTIEEGKYFIYIEHCVI